MKSTLPALILAAGVTATPIAQAHRPDPGAAAAAGFLGGVLGGLLLGAPPPPYYYYPRSQVIIERYPSPPPRAWRYDRPPRHFSHRDHYDDRDYRRDHDRDRWRDHEPRRRLDIGADRHGRYRDD